jgi:hypothetical protein
MRLSFLTRGHLIEFHLALAHFGAVSVSTLTLYIRPNSRAPSFTITHKTKIEFGWIQLKSMNRSLRQVGQDAPNFHKESLNFSYVLCH